LPTLKTFKNLFLSYKIIEIYLPGCHFNLKKKTIF
jgi:hypothetical protein